jgi:hypothetical protein
VPVRSGRIISAGRGPGPRRRFGRPSDWRTRAVEVRESRDINRRARAPRGCPWGQAKRSGPGVGPARSGPSGRTRRSDPSGGTRRPRSLGFFSTDTRGERVPERDLLPC